MIWKIPDLRRLRGQLCRESPQGFRDAQKQLEFSLCCGGGDLVKWVGRHGVGV